MELLRRPARRARRIDKPVDVAQPDVADVEIAVGAECSGGHARRLSLWRCNLCKESHRHAKRVVGRIVGSAIGAVAEHRHINEIAGRVEGHLARHVRADATGRYVQYGTTGARIHATETLQGVRHPHALTQCAVKPKDVRRRGDTGLRTLGIERSDCKRRGCIAAGRVAGLHAPDTRLEAVAPVRVIGDVQVGSFQGKAGHVDERRRDGVAGNGDSTRVAKQFLHACRQVVAMHCGGIADVEMGGVGRQRQRCDGADAGDCGCCAGTGTGINRSDARHAGAFGQVEVVADKSQRTHAAAGARRANRLDGGRSAAGPDDPHNGTAVQVAHVEAAARPECHGRRAPVGHGHHTGRGADRHGRADGLGGRVVEQPHDAGAAGCARGHVEEVAGGYVGELARNAGCRVAGGGVDDKRAARVQVDAAEAEHPVCYPQIAVDGAAWTRQPCLAAHGGQTTHDMRAVCCLCRQDAGGEHADDQNHHQGDLACARCAALCKYLAEYRCFRHDGPHPSMAMRPVRSIGS